MRLGGITQFFHKSSFILLTLQCEIYSSTQFIKFLRLKYVKFLDYKQLYNHFIYTYQVLQPILYFSIVSFLAKYNLTIYPFMRISVPRMIFATPTSFIWNSLLTLALTHFYLLFTFCWYQYVIHMQEQVNKSHIFNPSKVDMTVIVEI